MAMLKIPRPQQVGLAKLSALDDQAMNELFTALESAKPALFHQELAAKVGAKVSRIPKDDLDRILRAVLGMHQVRSAANVPASEFAEDVCKALEDSKTDSLKLPPERREVFKQRLFKLLGFDSSLGTTAKALDVMTEHERVLCGAGVITDIRSIFAKPSEKPTAAIIVHMLKISYHQDREHKDFYAALDTVDIRKLKEVLERAEQKAESLSAVLRSEGIPALDAP